MDSVTYNIPVELVEAYRGRRMIVRAHDPSAFVQHIPDAEIENVQYVQLLSLGAELSPLMHWGANVPVDIVMRDPAVEFPLLYDFSKLLDKHPTRASISVTPGFVKAVRLALALNFAVKLEVGQPGPDLIEEMAEVLDLYLHRPNVSQPVEFFHGVFLSIFRAEPSNLWFIQEEDPEQFRYVTDEGVETVTTRMGGIDLRGKLTAHDAEIPEAKPSLESECDTCEYLACCGGYFKWPDKEFSCDGVKTLFGTINEAATQLRRDLDALAAQRGGVQP